MNGLIVGAGVNTGSLTPRGCEGRTPAQGKRREGPGDASWLLELLSSRRAPEAELQRPSGAAGKSALGLPALAPASLPREPRAHRTPATNSRHCPGIRKGRSPISAASSSFPASIPRESHEDTWSWGPAAPGPPRRVPAQATVTTRHATHLLAGAGFALGRSPEERGPGGEEEVLGVLLQAAVAAAHAAGPVARRPPTRGAGGQAAGAAPARPVRLPARGPEPPAGCPPAAAAAAQSRRPGPSRCLPASPPACRRRLGGERPATPPPGPRPSSRGPRPARPGRLPTRSWQSRRGGRWGQRSPSASGAPLFPSRVWGTRLDSGAAVLRVAFPTARKLPIPRRSVHPPPPRLTRLWGRAQAEPGTCSTLPPALPLAGSSGWRWRL